MKNSSELSSSAIENYYKKIGQNVKKYREKKNYSQLQLAYAIGHKAVGLISQAELYHRKQHFNLEHLYKIAYVLECSVEDLIKQD